MATSYPGGLDAFTNPTATDSLASVSVPHATQHANVNDAIEAIQAELGLEPAGAVATVRARLDALDTTVSGKASSVHTHAQSDVTSLTTDLAAKAPLASPTFTGSVTIPTPTAGDSSTLAASTAFVAAMMTGHVIPASGFYIQTPIDASATLSAFALVEGRQYFTPIFITRNCTIDRLGISISNAGSAGSVVRLGLFADNAHSPGTVLAQGTIDSTGTGDKLATVSQAVTPGIYWLAAALQGGATTAAQAYGGFFNVSSWTATMGTNAAHVFRRVASGVTGTFTSTPSLGSLDSAGSGPRLVARIA